MPYLPFEETYLLFFSFFFLILNEMASFLKLSLRLYNVLLYYSLILSAINNYE